MFSYSERPKTLAERKFKDDVPEEVKKRRLAEIVSQQQQNSATRTASGVGKVHKVLIESTSKKSKEQWSGRNSQNTIVVFDKGNYKQGDYVNVLAEKCTTSTLIGRAIS
jgi:tRNA-2-methylthio-N6-dimethylallyladenosine synthase